MHVYLDYNATTPLHESVKEILIESLSFYENPSSKYSEGAIVKTMINTAKFHCSELIGTEPNNIIFTSGGSESNNTILNSNLIKQLSAKNKNRNEIIISTIEHPSVTNCAKALEREGYVVHYSTVDINGRILFDKFESLLSERTALVSILLANNELGTIQDIRKFADLAHKYGALFHTDAVQAVGKIPVNVKELDTDYLSYSGHKIYAPKGIGILYIRENSPFIPLIYGGNQQGGKRSGTENTSGIIGIGKAAELTKNNMDKWYKNTLCLKNKLVEGLTSTIKDIRINGDMDNCLPQTINISFLGTEAEVVQIYLDNKNIKVSTGSACSSGKPSTVLKAIGLDQKTANSAIRFSLGIYNTEAEIDYTIKELQNIIQTIRKY